MDKKVFILNKPFQGGYTEVDGNIAHEIINFFRADDCGNIKGGIYIHNNPWGHCGDNVYIDGDGGPKKEYQLQYMLLTSSSELPKGDEKKNKTKWSEFYVTHVIELKRILHHKSTSKKIGILKENQNYIKKIIDQNNIKYGGLPLYQIYDDDDASLYVTFEANKIYVPKKKSKRISITIQNYLYQRNKGYIYSDKEEDAYNEIQTKIINNLSLDWEEFNVKPINTKQKQTIKKTFLDLIIKKYSEECYTNILYHFLSFKDMMKRFIKDFVPNTTIADDDFIVNREKVIETGRMDISANTKDNGGKSQRIVIENKILSGINGVRELENGKESQLDDYYHWAKLDKGLEPICLIIAPNYRIEEIKAEAEEVSPKVYKHYRFIGYKEISLFIKKHKEDYQDISFIYSGYIDDVITVFENFAASNRSDFFESIFLTAINSRYN